MDYEKRRQNEIDNYRNVTNVHDLPEIYHYWSGRYLKPKFEAVGYADLNDFYLQQIAAAGDREASERIAILSVGSGNCDAEVDLAQRLLADGVREFTLACLDLNPAMLERGRQLAAEAGLAEKFEFICADINAWEPDCEFDVLFANQCLHHFVELESLFDSFHRSLKETGVLLTNDMIGRNGHMRWPEALPYIEALWATLDRRYQYNHQKQQYDEEFVNWDCSGSSFEGIRAQDILPLLCERFHFETFIGFTNLMTPFIDRAYGHNFDPENPLDCQFIDIVARMDEYCIDKGILKPTQMVAALTKSQLAPERYYRHWSSKYWWLISAAGGACTPMTAPGTGLPTRMVSMT